MKVYLDNAATTAIHPAVVEAMIPVLSTNFGNPSSIHGFGREARSIIENARKSIAKHLHVSPAEIFFTSGGTEANNMAINGAIRDLGVTHIITSPIEHHAVLHTAEEQHKLGKVKLSIVNLNDDGSVDIAHLKELLSSNGKTLVSLMHANNEIGNLLSLQEVGEICEQYGAIFHSDTVQTMAHYPFNLQELKVHFITCSAHKFHGPKGIGFIYIKSDVKINPFIFGGAQERNMRGGTENIYGIVGLAKAMDIALEDLENDMARMKSLKKHMIDQLREAIPGVQFNGQSANDNSLYTVLNVSLPPADFAEMLLFRLDIAGIAASGGSACSSGSNVGSHVLNAIKASPDRPAVRFSFGKFTTKEEIDYCVNQLKELYAGVLV